MKFKNKKLEIEIQCSLNNLTKPVAPNLVWILIMLGLLKIEHFDGYWLEKIPFSMHAKAGNLMRKEWIN